MTHYSMTWGARIFCRYLQIVADMDKIMDIDSIKWRLFPNNFYVTCNTYDHVMYFTELWVNLGTLLSLTEFLEETKLPSFYPNVTTLRSGICYRKSVCRLSVVVCARQFTSVCTAWHLSISPSRRSSRTTPTPFCQSRTSGLSSF